MTVMEAYAELHEDSVPTCDSYDEYSQQHWQDRTAAVTDEFIRLKYQLETLQREKERDASMIASLKHEVGGITGRLSALAVEHRENRNHWLAEKSELESRTFQMLALQTQYQGTMRKKEKDYEKLQGQLDKVVRDSQRGNKAVINVSKPLQKNSSQQKTGTLVDAELTAAKSIIVLLQHENDDLRIAVDGLAQSVQMLQGEIVQNEIQREKEYHEKQEEKEKQQKQKLLKQQRQLGRPNVTFSELEGEGHFVTAPSTPSVSDPSSDLRRKEEFTDTLNSLVFMDQTYDLSNDIEGEVENKNNHDDDDNNSEDNCDDNDEKDEDIDDEKKERKEKKNIEEEQEDIVPGEDCFDIHFNQEPLTPLPLINCLNDVTTEGTPSARPVRWMVGQVSTEVRKLRERAERANDSAYTPRARNSGDQMNLKKKLSEAFSVIQEQDRLIHHALFGHITGLYDTAGVHQNNFSADRVSLSPDSEIFSPLPKYNCSSANYSTTRKSGKFDDSFTDFDVDFLPPASPATMEILRAHNWPLLPRESSKERSVCKEHSSTSNFKEHSPLRSTKKNILHTVQDTLASLLSFSPDVVTDPRSILLERKGMVHLSNLEMDSAANTNLLHDDGDKSKDDNDRSSNNNDINNNSLTTNKSGDDVKDKNITNIKSSVKKTIKQSIPTYKRISPTPNSTPLSMRIQKPDNDENSILYDKKNVDNNDENQLEIIDMKKKCIGTHVSLIGREITENEHIKSHKKLIVGKEINEKDYGESTGPRTLDMNEI